MIAASAGCVRAGGGTPPTVICGVVLSTSRAGPLVYDVTSSRFVHGPPVNAPTVGGVVMVQVARGCEVGSEVTITPADAFKVIHVVRAAENDLPVALVLGPVRSVPALLVARQNGIEVGWLRLDISKGDLDKWKR